jgi:hypothetical protein
MFGGVCVALGSEDQCRFVQMLGRDQGFAAGKGAVERGGNDVRAGRRNGAGLRAS